MFTKGDLVRLKNSYEGYFDNFKGKTLTVQEVIPRDPSINGIALKIEEFSELEPFHLILQKHFVSADEEQS